MNRNILWVALFLALCPALALAQSQAELREKLADKIERVQRLAKAPVLIDAVKAQNAEGLNLATIKQRDEAWKGGDKTLTNQLAETPAGNFLASTVRRNRAIYNEAFLTDNQGANVACWPATSDYWQGDETKWSAAWAGGKGEVYIGEIEQDESTNTSAVQISVPVEDGGKTLGVLVVGVKLSYIEKR